MGLTFLGLCSLVNFVLDLVFSDLSSLNFGLEVSQSKFLSLDNCLSNALSSLLTTSILSLASSSFLSVNSIYE